MDNERYTYGYQNGWRVENEYLSEVNSLLEDYNAQKEVVDNIRNERVESPSSPIPTDDLATDEEIRNWYVEDGIRMSFDAYRQNFREQEQRRLEEKKQEYESDVIQAKIAEDNKNDRYSANLYVLTEVKDVLRRELNRQKRELEFKLSQAELNLEQINLNQRRVSTTDRDTRLRLRDEYDSTFLEMQKLRHALERVDEIFDEISITQEEQDLLMSGLNPRAKNIYNEIKNPSKDQKNVDPVPPGPVPPGPVPPGPIPPGPIPPGPVPPGPIPPGPVPPGPDPVDLDLSAERDAILNAISEYNDLLNEYKDLFEMYRDAFIALGGYQQAYEEGTIDYEEYAKYADYMAERDRYLAIEYQKIEALYENISRRINEYNNRVLNANPHFAGLTDNELEQRLAELQLEYNDEYYFRAHQENGMEQHEDDELNNLLNRINDIRLELNRRKVVDLISQINAPEEPWKSGILQEVLDKGKPIPPEPIPPHKDDVEYYTRDIYQILRDIGIDKDGNQYKFKNIDSFVYSCRNASVWNWEKRKERTILNVPYKLFKTTTGAAITISEKIASGVLSLNAARRERCESAINAINNLPEEDLWIAYDYFTNPTKMKGNFGAAPKFILEALQNRVYSFILGKLNEYNEELENYYLDIVELYRQAQAEMENGALESDVSMTYSGPLLNAITNYLRTYSEIDALINKGGAQAMRDNLRARKNTLTGGIHSSSKDHSDVRDLIGSFSDVMNGAIANGDGLVAAEAFLHREHSFVNFEEIKRTLKNRLGKANVGATSYSPIVEIADYSEYTFVSDMLKTAALIGSIYSGYMIFKLTKGLEQANQVIDSLNRQIQAQNQIILNIQNILKGSQFNADVVSNQVSELLKNLGESLRQSSEYVSEVAQAGALGSSVPTAAGTVYNQIDDEMHQFAADIINQVNTINNTFTGSARLNELMKLFKSIGDKQQYVYNVHDANLLKYINTVTNPSHLENWTGLLQASSTVAALDTSFIMNEFNAIINLIKETGNLQLIQAASKVNVSASIVPAILTASSIALEAGADKSKVNRILSKIKKEADKKAKEKQQDTKDKMKDAVTSVKFDDEKKAEKRFEKAMDEWNSHSAFYRLAHRGEKPKVEDFYREEFISEYGVGGKSR